MLGLLSDAHGNLPGFLAGLALLEGAGATRFAFLGDAVGYIPTWDVVDELERRRDLFTFVLGNHEQALLAATISGNDRIYRHRELLESSSPDRIAFLSTWKTSATLELRCGDALLVHGSPSDPQNGYLYPDTPLDDLQTDATLLFCGHTHRPFDRTVAATRVVNIGSCGLPRDDGRYGSVALLDERSGDVRIIRYLLGDATHAYVDRFEVDSSVKGLFARRAPNVYGDLDA